MKCPRCSASITQAPDASGYLVCAGCGARLRTARAAAVTVLPVGEEVAAKSSRAQFPGTRPVGMPVAGDIDSMLERLEPDGPPAPSLPDPPNPNATLPPGTPLRAIPRVPRDTADDTAKVLVARRRSEPLPPEAGEVTLGTLLGEIRALQRTQAEILVFLRSTRTTPAGLPSMSEDDDGGSLGFPDEDGPAEPLRAPTADSSTPVRSRRRKTVVLIDDDAASREAAVAAMQTAEVPVRAVGSGQDGLAAIAELKPDVIVLELAIEGEMGGKDVVNMIKATMEWVDIPIVLYTRVPVESQREARTIHGADEFVLKSNGPDSLVSRVITLFRKG